MLHINPIQYPALIKRSFNILSISADRKTLEISLESNTPRITYGKSLRLVIIMSNGMMDQYFGIYGSSYISKSVKHYLYLSKPLDEIITTSDVFNVYETFATSNDAQAISIMDVYDSVKGSESDINELGELSIGSLGFISGFQSNKINSVLYDFAKSEEIEITNAFTDICNIRIYNPDKTNTEDELTRFKIYLYPTNTSHKSLFDADIVIDSNGTYASVKLNSHVFQDNAYSNITNNFAIRLTKYVYTDGSRYVNVKLGLVEVAGTFKFKGYIGCKHYDDLFLSTSSVKSSTAISLNGNEENICDRTLISLDTYGEQRISTLKETIFTGTELTSELISDQTPGHYIIKQSTKPADIPGGSADKTFSADDEKEYTINWDFANLIIYPKNKYGQKPDLELSDNTCMMITDNGRIFIGEIRRSENFVNWKELSNNLTEIYAKDVIEDNEHQFVSQDEKDVWNGAITELSNNVWGPTVTNEAARPSNPLTGYTCTVLNSTVYGGKKVTYQYIGDNKWVPITPNILPVMATTESQMQYSNGGTLVDLDFIAKVNSTGIGKTLNLKEQFISSFNTENTYQTLDNKNFFDLVKRSGTTNLAYDGSINIGFSNDMLKTNSIGIGSNLKTGNKNESIMIGTGLIQKALITLGKYNDNNDNNSLLLSIGNGTSDSSRKTVFNINENGIVTTTSNYVIDGIGPNYFLTSGGYTDESLYAKKTWVESLVKDFAVKTDYGYFAHLDINNNDIDIPIVFICDEYIADEDSAFDLDNINEEGEDAEE